MADETVKASFDALKLPGLAVQQYGTEGTSCSPFFRPNPSRPRTSAPHSSQAISAHFSDNKATIQRLEMVGPKVGADLRNAALEAMFSILLITVYISGRFEHRWGIAALMAAALGGAMYLMGLVGLDMPLRVLGALVDPGLPLLETPPPARWGPLWACCATCSSPWAWTLFGKEFDLNIIAALLTLVGLLPQRYHHRL